MQKRNLGRVAAVFAVLVAIMLALPGAAYAKTVRAKVFPSYTTVTQFKQGVKAVRGGTTTVKFSTSDGYIKFTATRTKTYKFTFSNAKGTSTPQIAVGVLRKLKGSTLVNYSVKTAEKSKRQYLPIYDAATAQELKGQTYSSGGKTYKYLGKRTAKLKLQKGQTVYIDIAGKTAGSLKLKIK